MNQSFEIKELKRFGKQYEFREESDWENQVTAACQNILDETFEFEIKQVGSYFLTESFSNKLILRKLNDNIKRIYKDEQANRKTIISQIKTLMDEKCPSWIIKTDIKSFYESINRKQLLTKFKDNSILSYCSLFLLNKLFSNEALQNSVGVPRGMNVSATLSEIYLRKFDKWVCNYRSVFYYARFVDDIIIFTYSKQDALLLLKSINEKLKELAKGLIINNLKTQLFDGLSLKQLNITDGIPTSKDNFLEYLGYRFTKKADKKNYLLEISIADKKIKKIKSRIAWSFADYLKTNDFSLLNNRIKFLTGNYSIRKRKDENSDLRAGIYFNYSELSNLEILDKLNLYYRKILFARNGTFGTKLNSKLSSVQKERLKKYCFKSGFENKIYYDFSHSQVKKIVHCW